MSQKGNSKTQIRSATRIAAERKAIEFGVEKTGIGRQRWTVGRSDDKGVKEKQLKLLLTAAPLGNLSKCHQDC
jgi:hypothetical protein